MAKYLALLCLCIFLLAGCSENNDINQDSQPKVSHLFDPYELKEGDQVKSWTITKIEDNYFNAPDGFSIMTSFDGKAEISGTFEYYYDDAIYTGGDVIFRLDESSTARVPIPIAYGDRQETQINLLFNKKEDKALFGPPGTTGNAKILISDFQTVMAEAYDGVIDNAKFEKLINIESIPPDQNL